MEKKYWILLIGAILSWIWASRIFIRLLSITFQPVGYVIGLLFMGVLVWAILERGTCLRKK